MKPLSKIKRPAKPVLMGFKPSKIRLLIDLRGLREDANVSLREAADQLKIGHATIARIEWGNAPDMTTAFKLAKFYERRIDEIWGLK